ncbi:MAG: hypothetical protein IPG43_12390 [Proteobacteria bacterium]|nr:hypothetical protein [Pseudomonadota bacterium]
MAEKFFTDAELREMEKLTLERLTDAIDAGDADKAKKIARRMYNEFLAMHDLYRNWVTATLSEIARRHGDQELEQIMNEGVRAWWMPALNGMPKGHDQLRGRIKMFAAGLQGHLQPLEISEDDEKVEIKMKPCGSGGRLVQEGKYEGPDAFHKIAKPQPLTYGRPDYPVYCAHEYSMEKVDIEANGKPFVVVEPAAELGREYCSMLIYKDPDKIPAKYYERLGLKKPG